MNETGFDDSIFNRLFKNEDVANNKYARDFIYNELEKYIKHHRKVLKIPKGGTFEKREAPELEIIVNDKPGWNEDVAIAAIDVMNWLKEEFVGDGKDVSLKMRPKK
jgi:hypothetical protein